MSENWLVTGGCGFIGVNLIRFLKARGAYIRVLDNLSLGAREDLATVAAFEESQETGTPDKAKVHLMAADIRDPEAALKAARGMDVIVHLAARAGVIQSVEDPVTDFESNVAGTLNMLMAAKESGAKKFIFASSGAPLGSQEPPVHEGKVPRPLSPYGAAKLAGEAYCQAFNGSYGMNTVILRFSNVYGPFSQRKTSVVAAFIHNILSDKPLTVYGDGSQTRDFLYVEDLCRAIIGASEKDAGGETFHVASGSETSIAELAEELKKLAQKDSGKKVEIRNEPPRRGEIIRNFSDISKARRMLGYEPEFDLSRGLEQTWKWFKSRMP